MDGRIKSHLVVNNDIYVLTGKLVFKVPNVLGHESQCLCVYIYGNDFLSRTNRFGESQDFA